jgi:heptaprenyl diphosphate synthase
MNNKKIAQTAVIASLALVLGYIESLLPALLPVPGIKLGLSNLAVLFALYRTGTKSAWGIMIIKVLVSSLLFSGFQTFWYSAAGGVLSLLGMSLLKRFNILSVFGISAAGGILHNIGQLLSAAFILKTTSVFWYLPPLLISGTVTGFLIGAVCSLLLSYIKKQV